jgi:carbon monoxide dehydrogenase subunit G
MATIERSIDIAAPPERVWDLLEDVRRLPEYSESTDEVREAPERLTAVGQEYVQVGRLLGMKLTSRWRVTAIDPGRLLSSEGSLAPGVRYTLTQHVEPLDAGRTRLSIDIDYSIPGGALGRLAARAGAEARAGREAQAVLDGIRSTLEASPS